MKETFLITGATGTTAMMVAAQLREKGADVRAMVRNEAKAADLKSKGIALALADFDDPESLGRALEGVTSVFLVTPPSPNDFAMAERFLEAAKNSPMRPRIVRLSAIKACADGPSESSRNHGRIDRLLVNSDLSYVILRPNYFMQNFLGSAESIVGQGMLFQGTGDANIGFIDVRDIADVAAACLLDRSWDRGIYDLTGPTTLSFHGVATELGGALGREVKYVPITPDEIRKSVLDKGWGEWGANLFADYARAYGRGWGDFTTAFVEKITGHAPRSVAVFAREVFAPALQRSDVGRGGNA